jgi:hypothetical protein
VQYNVLLKLFLSAGWAQVLNESVQEEDSAVWFKALVTARSIGHESEVNPLRFLVEVSLRALRGTGASHRLAVDMGPHGLWVVKSFGGGHGRRGIGSSIVVRRVFIVAGVWLGGHIESLLRVGSHGFVGVAGG